MMEWVYYFFTRQRTVRLITQAASGQLPALPSPVHPEPVEGSAVLDLMTPVR
jgi:hypothetical protein